VNKPMSLYEALSLALSEIYDTLHEIEQDGGDPKDWMTPPEDLREAARIIDIHMRAARMEHKYLNRNSGE
jgi:hypothetical protein